MADAADKSIPTGLRVVVLVISLAAFLVAIDMIGRGAKTLNKSRVQQAEELPFNWANPVVGLALGVLGTVLVQSSSVSTTTIVAMVGASQISVEHAVPMVIGANIGTTVTNTIVSIGHISRAHEFRLAFTAATVHDFFNVCATLILLPLEIATGAISKSAMFIVAQLDLDPSSAIEFKSPIKVFVGTVSKGVLSFLTDTLGLQKTIAAYVLIAIALILIFVCLVAITKNMRKLIARRVEVAMNTVLAKSGALGLLIGMLITISVQSSSITTSILVPMCGAGILTIANAYPIILGANLGTTTTALLGSIVTGPAGVTIAVVHLVFNLSGILIFYPLRFMRKIPITLAERMADSAVKHKLLVLAYLIGAFILLPLAVLVLLG